MKEIIFDGDILPYRFGFKHADTPKDKFHLIIDDINKFLSSVIKKLKCPNYVIYLTGENNFRKKVAVSYEYKAKRAPKPEWHKAISEYLVEEEGAIVCDWGEADDAIAIHLTQNPKAIHAGIDKDLYQVKGWHYSYGTHNKLEEHPFYVDEIGYLRIVGSPTKSGMIKKLKGTGLKWFYAQMLLGDTTDNIVGLENFGDVGVFKLLSPAKDESELFSWVYGCYECCFNNPEERFLENARLLWMVRELDSVGNPVMWDYQNWWRA